MNEELNRSTGSFFKPDDKKDYTAVIIDRWHAAARARCRMPFQPPPKPVKVIIAKTKITVSKAKIGARPRYSFNVMLGIFQLNRLSTNEKLISSELSIPIGDVRRILKHETPVSNKAWILAQQTPLPSKSEIIGKLSKEP